jgi:phi13 family phage major tail protein
MAQNVSAFATKRVIIGVEDVRFCKITSDDSTGLVYDTTTYKAPGVVEIALSWQVTNEKLAADDNPAWEIMNSVDYVDITLTIASVSNAMKAFLLGHATDVSGGIVVSTNDAAPSVAMGFKTLRADGKFDYCWFYKGQFVNSDETFRTKEQGKTNWQTPKITGTFAATHYNGRISNHVSEGDPSVTEAYLSTYLTTVAQPALPEPPAGGT